MHMSHTVKVILFILACLPLILYSIQSLGSFIRYYKHFIHAEVNSKRSFRLLWRLSTCGTDLMALGMYVAGVYLAYAECFGLSLLLAFGAMCLMILDQTIPFIIVKAAREKGAL